MIAAAHVNVHYLLLLLLPAVVACIALALTWYSRAKSRRESDAKRAARNAPGAKPRARGGGSRSKAKAKRRRR